MLLVSGTLNDVVAALQVIFSKLDQERQSSSKQDPVRMVLPSSVCGGIIGKAGANIKALVADSGANIRLSPNGQRLAGIYERVVTITGQVHETVRAIALILSRLEGNPNYNLAALPMSYKPLRPGADVARRGLRRAPPAGPVEKVLGVADEHAGIVIGKGGGTLAELQRATASRVTVSARGEFLPGTSQRIVKISGYAHSVAAAEKLIESKILAAAAADKQ